MQRRFDQLDVFSAVPLMGNPLAVVHDAQGLSDERMAALARWTNLSETTFLLPPTEEGADYKVRIFTPQGELPFAGHPTLGSCHAWLAAGGVPRQDGLVVQECGVGLVRIRNTATAAGGSRLAFAAPPLRRTGPMEPMLVRRVAAGLGVAADDIMAHQWIDNGPGWCAVMLRSAAQVLAVRPDWTVLGGALLGVVGPQLRGSDTAFEVRAFVPGLGVSEDPVTGSLNAGMGQWLIAAGLAPNSYVAAQGAALGRAGRVYVDRATDGSQDIWVGGDVAVCIEGSVTL